MDDRQAIEEIREKMGRDLNILAHHYQADEVVRHADILGDSLELARKIDGLNAENIVFCGVHFMAESAAILARSGQKVFIPDSGASCVMAEMVPAGLAEQVLQRLQAGGARIIPLTYVNSSAAVKAVCGRYGGSVCTSANAEKMLRWALGQADGVLFMPDANLGRNTAQVVGLKPMQMRRLDIRRQGGYVEQAHPGEQLYLWPGVCGVHYKFRAAHIAAIRSSNPAAKIYVHPECSPDVVELADGAGSTSYLIRMAAEAPPGAELAIGTEYHLVERLIKQYAGQKNILPLFRTSCSNMVKVTETKLRRQLESLEAQVPVSVDEHIASQAHLALERMLDVCR
jgi:quinolinate synthase